MDSFERRADARAMEEMQQHPGYLAMLRLIERMKRDTLLSLASDTTVNRKHVRGYLAGLDELVRSVNDEVAYCRDLERAEEEGLAFQRGRSLDGEGTGDLA